MKFINIYMDSRGLWTASLCKDAKELASLGGSYPKSINASRDAQSKWGRDLEVKTSYSPMFTSKEIKNEVIKLLSAGEESEAVAAKFRLKPSWVRAVKAHVAMGTYDETMKLL
jgi:hypothetical protein